MARGPDAVGAGAVGGGGVGTLADTGSGVSELPLLPLQVVKSASDGSTKGRKITRTSAAGRTPCQPRGGIRLEDPRGWLLCPPPTLSREYPIRTIAKPKWDHHHVQHLPVPVTRTRKSLRFLGLRRPSDLTAEELTSGSNNETASRSLTIASRPQ